ncbi:MAG: tryptophan synthase subunit alpha [Elusimicrobiota bacterium]|jgi:tryptophan synthase alpha chain
MNRIDKTFQQLKAKGRKALIGYVTAGFPNKSSLKRLIPLLEEAGLDLLELGVPFSDPIADGPTIQRASQVALSNGVTLEWILETVRELRSRVKLPIILMSYSNPVYAMGVERFFQKAQASGVDGLIVPDMIPEEAALFKPAQSHGVHRIYLAAPTTPSERIRMIAQATRGFLYVVSLTGVTGARSALSPGLSRFLKKVKAISRQPVAVGFGLSTPAHVKAVAPYADGVIIGSALIKEIEKSKSNGFAGAVRYVRSLHKALNAKERTTHAS